MDLVRKIWGDDNFEFRFVVAIGRSGGMVIVRDKDYFKANKEYPLGTQL